MSPTLVRTLWVLPGMRKRAIYVPHGQFNEGTVVRIHDRLQRQLANGELEPPRNRRSRKLSRPLPA